MPEPKRRKEEIQTIDGLVSHFVKNHHQFERIAGELNAAFTASPHLKPLVHSVKWRIKDPAHLREKLIRKTAEAKKEGRLFAISPSNLFQKINDLVGFRLLHLYTRETDKLNSALVQSLSEGYKLIEGPSARTWDDESRQYFEGIGITTEASDTMYTSVHYVFETRSVTKFTCEVQVRTLAEELWGEVDHAINYPTPVNIVACSEQIKVLARLTSACTRLVDSIYSSMDAACARPTPTPLVSPARTRRDKRRRRVLKEET
jgi:ppGpp synthetase/RelA/SpoT-type nucleotidyltranferase